MNELISAFGGVVGQAFITVTIIVFWIRSLSAKVELLHDDIKKNQDTMRDLGDKIVSHVNNHHTLTEKENNQALGTMEKAHDVNQREHKEIVKAIKDLATAVNHKIDRISSDHADHDKQNVKAGLLLELIHKEVQNKDCCNERSPS